MQAASGMAPDPMRRHECGRRVLRAVDIMNKGLVKLCGLALVAMVLSVTLGILVRFVFSHMDIQIRASWTEEVSRYLMIWSVFVGAAVAARSGKLIGVEALVTYLPAIMGRSLKYIAHALSLVFYGVLCWVGLAWIEFGESQSSPVLQMPLTYLHASMTVGGVLLIINTLALILEARINGKDIRHAAIDDELESALASMDNAAKAEARA